MGAKQSKRSVDISGKEAESAGEVAAAGAGGEGRVEALADVDALKPQANGAAHIHEQTVSGLTSPPKQGVVQTKTPEPTNKQDKEKELDSGTPENEKDATTEKESKDGTEEAKEDDKKEPAVTNGEAEKPEGGDPAPAAAPEEGKKPKKEKVKKKWSLRSISFSRKDKPKQEKKQKEEEPKTNGEPEKVPEEVAEVTPENATNKVAEEAKPEAVKEEKTPETETETPVTEPLTNGSSAPESPRAPEHLPVNGLSLQEQKSDAPEAQSEESKPEQPTTDPTEPAPAPEIPVKIEVCVERMPVESTPPPLPANPPPSSVASFAATTMAPELTGLATAAASLPDTAPPHLPPQNPQHITDNNTETAATELPPPLKEPVGAAPAAHAEPAAEKVPDTGATQAPPLPDVKPQDTEVETVEPVVEKVEPETVNVESPVEKIEPAIQEVQLESQPDMKQELSEIDSGTKKANEKLEEITASPVKASGDSCPESNVDTFETVKNEIVLEDTAVVEEPPAKVESPDVEMPPAPIPDDLEIPEPVADSPDTTEDLPPPPPPIEEEEPAEKALNNAHETKEKLNHITENVDMNGVDTEQLNGNVHTEEENLKNKTKDSLGPAPPAAPPAEPLAAPRAATPQEPLPVSEKLADLIPEVPVVPELNTQTETSTDVALAN